MPIHTNVFFMNTTPSFDRFCIFIPFVLDYQPLFRSAFFGFLFAFTLGSFSECVKAFNSTTESNTVRINMMIAGKV